MNRHFNMKELVGAVFFDALVAPSDDQLAFLYLVTSKGVFEFSGRGAHISMDTPIRSQRGGVIRRAEVQNVRRLSENILVQNVYLVTRHMNFGEKWSLTLFERRRFLEGCSEDRLIFPRRVSRDEIPKTVPDWDGRTIEWGVV